MIVQGKVNAKDRDGKPSDEVKVMVDKAKRLDPSVYKHYIPTGETVAPKVDPAAAQPAERVVLKIKDLRDQVLLLRLKSILQAVPGDTETMVQLETTGQKIRLPFKVAVSEKLKQNLTSLLTEEAVLVE